jgi:hypothetical protein
MGVLMRLVPAGALQADRAQETRAMLTARKLVPRD